MSFLGTSYCKFSGSSAEVLLENSLLNPIWCMPDELEHTSIINGKRTYITKGDYAQFQVTVFLNKYSDPYAKYREILSHKGTLVEFYPFVSSGGEKIKDYSGETVYLYLSDVVPFYLNNTELFDAVSLKFISQKYIFLGTVDTGSLGYGYLYSTKYGKRL